MQRVIDVNVENRDEVGRREDDGVGQCWAGGGWSEGFLAEG